jgi:hypothetical protein
MTQPLHGHTSHFASLLEHLGAFEQTRREQLAELYGASSAEPVDIALQWCRHPEAFASVVKQQIGDSAAWSVLEQLAQEHDLPVDVDWVDARSQKALAELGLLKASSKRRSAGSDWVPGAVAAILAPLLSGTRPTIPILLGRRSQAQVEAIAEQWGIPTDNSKIETILRISEAFAQPEFIDHVLDRLPHPDWIAGAMMTLELGGICYWREVFGHEVEDGSTEDNVVPLMRSDERDEQRLMADRLLDLGVLYKIEDDTADFSLVALPEELWFGLWSVGQSWLYDWTSLTFSDLEDVAVRQSRESREWDVQKVFKWLVCEARAERLDAFDGALTEDSLSELDRKTPRLDIDWQPVIDMAFDLEVLEMRGADVVASSKVFDMLDLPRAVFVREILGVWVLGVVGTATDEAMGEAIGLDDEWVEHLVAILQEYGEGLAPWMLTEGVPHVETGAGCLREVEEDDEELMLLELGLTNTCLCLTKIHWLDLLSLLETDEWYSVQGLSDLLQMSASHAIFSQLGHIIQDPHSNYYFPVQRPSLLSLPIHAEAFESWVRDIVDGLLGPLGVAELSADGERLWLDTRNLRVASPPEWPEEPRMQLVREVLADPEFDFVLPEGNGASLHTVPEFDDQDVVPIDLPMDALDRACHEREVVEFDGKTLRLS